MDHSHWHILGAGAIGCLFAQALQQESTTTLLLRPGVQHSNAIRVQKEGAEVAVGMTCSYTSDAGGIDQLLITTKAYDAATALDSVAHRLNKGATIVLLVNGMGILERLQSAYPHHDIFCATTTAGAYRLGPLHIQPAGNGQTRVGRQQQTQPAPWFDGWRKALHDCQWDADIEGALWHKLAINSVINPLTAIHRCRNGQLAERDALRDLVQQLCQEASQISYAAGFTQTAQSLQKDVECVIRDTADNRSSMLQDIEAGRPTEIDYITGYLLTIADAHGIVSAQHRALFDEVKKRAL